MNTQLLRAIQQENVELKDEVSRLRDYVHALQALHHAIQQLLTEKDLMKLVDRTLYDNLKAASKDLDELVRDIKTNPDRYVRIKIF